MMAESLIVMKIAISEQQQMETLLRGLDTILYLINQCEIYEILYIRDPQPVEALEYLESALVELYAVILQFLANANRLFGKNTPSRALYAFFNPSKCTDFENECQLREKRVEEQAEQCERLYNRNARTNGTLNAERLQTLLQDIKKQNDVLIETVSKLWDRSNAEERRKILQWASDIACQDHHNLARNGRTPDTGEWLLRHKNYERWQSASESMILWLHGIRKFRYSSLSGTESLTKVNSRSWKNQTRF
jgi:ankyrin repeat domain-containing protein 50